MKSKVKEITRDENTVTYEVFNMEEHKCEPVNLDISIIAEQSIEECDELAKKLLRKPAVSGVMITLMAWFPEFDDLGRPLNADPNLKDYVVKDGENNKFYHITKRGWKSHIYETFNAENYPGKQKGKEIYFIDETPDYIKKSIK